MEVNNNKVSNRRMVEILLMGGSVIVLAHTLLFLNTQSTDFSLLLSLALLSAYNIVSYYNEGDLGLSYYLSCYALGLSLLGLAGTHFFSSVDAIMLMLIPIIALWLLVDFNQNFT